MRYCKFVVVLALGLFVLFPAAAQGQDPPPFSKEQVEQLVAPVALYPDQLLSQILMASTYPADVVDAAKWVKANPNQKGEEAVRAVENQSWDPSVKSLVAFPQVMEMMSSKPDWVQNLGDAFLASSKDVLDAVQRLRQRAQAAGNLKSTEQQKVVVEPATQVVQIEPTDPEVIYVPSYNPTVVYGPWPYPAYPPYYYPPPPYYGYPPGYGSGALLGFTAGIIAGGALWGDCDWNNGDIDIDVDHHNEFNRNNKIERGDNKFQHRAENRRGTPYRDQKSRDRFGKDVPGASQRNDFRGRDGARDTQRRQAQSTLQDRGMDPGAGRESLRNDSQVRDRAERASGGFDRGGADRSLGGGDNAFRDAGDGRASRQQFDRGSSSRQSMNRGSSGFGGGSRGGGGFGGGGRGGGGRGGGGRR